MSKKIATASTATLSVWIDPRKSDDPALNGLSLMNRLWNQLDGMFIGRWARNFPDERAMDNWVTVWAQAFVDEGITPEEVARGLTALRRSKYMPDLPEFLELCRPRLSDEDAYYEALKQIQLRRAPFKRDGELVTADQWSDPAIYWAAVSMERDLLNMPYAQLKSRWSKALENARRNPKGAVPEYRIALPKQGTCSITPEEQKRVINELMASLGKVAPKASAAAVENRRTNRQRP